MFEAIKPTDYAGLISNIVLPKDYRREATEFFLHRGWSVVRCHESEVDSQEIKLGEAINCGDNDRDYKAPQAPALFGATHGVVRFTDPSIPMRERYKISVGLIEASGHINGDHGDKDHGDIHGCKFVSAALSGLIPGIDGLCEADIRWARANLRVGHQTLERRRDSTGLLLNFREGSTVVPNGEFHSVDPLYLLSLVEKLGRNFEDVLRDLEYTGKLVLPNGRRKLYIV